MARLKDTMATKPFGPFYAIYLFIDLFNVRFQHYFSYTGHLPTNHSREISVLDFHPL